MREVTIEARPEPSEEEREAILAALERPVEETSAWERTALREGVETGDAEP